MPEGAVLLVDDVLVDAGADPGGPEGPRVVGGGRVDDAHHDVGAHHAAAVGAHVGRAERKPPHGVVVGHLGVQEAALHAPQQPVLALLQLDGVVVLVLADKRIEAIGAGGSVALRNLGLGRHPRVRGDVGAGGVVVAVAVLRAPDLQPLAQAAQRLALALAGRRAGVGGVVHAAHPAVHGVVAALELLHLGQLPGAADAGAGAGLAVGDGINHHLAHTSEALALALVEGLVWREEHAAVPEPGLVLLVGRHAHGVRGSIELRALELVVEVLVDTVAQHEDEHVASTKVNSGHGPVTRLQVEVPGAGALDNGGGAGRGIVLHQEAGDEGDEEALVGVHLDGHGVAVTSQRRIVAVRVEVLQVPGAAGDVLKGAVLLGAVHVPQEGDIRGVKHVAHAGHEGRSHVSDESAELGDGRSKGRRAKLVVRDVAKLHVLCGVEAASDGGQCGTGGAVVEGNRLRGTGASAADMCSKKSRATEVCQARDSRHCEDACLGQSCLKCSPLVCISSED
mmetsp:Transcript_22788/g.57466  ORF Transcript_22788/g.57466 Transcript_22788/m.57466 type:complete len:508 (+) Transcript_22788:536-2059(+)